MTKTLWRTPKLNIKIRILLQRFMTMPTSLAAFRKSVSNLPASTKSKSAGELQLLDRYTDKIVTRRRLHANYETLIGRDRTRCQWTLDDPYLSAKHLRIYTIVYEDGEENGTNLLVYAEDLSRYGTYWNGALIGKGNGGYLLSQGDRLRLSSRTMLRFITTDEGDQIRHFDVTQEREMNEFHDEYVLTDRLLGTGAYGRVFMAIDVSSRAQIACKVVDLRKLMRKDQIPVNTERPASAQDVIPGDQLRKLSAWANQRKRNDSLEYKLQKYFREVEILSSITHPNVICVDKVYVTDNTMYIFQDLITAGDLFSYLEMKNNRLLESEAAVIVRQIVIAVEFLHKNLIVHRDVKLENIMVTSTSTGARIVLTDFGAARRVQHVRQRMISAVGTEGYSAPEIKHPNAVPDKKYRAGYTTAADMWSVGTVAVMLLTGNAAFTDPKTGTHSSKLADTCNLDFLQKSKEWQELRHRPKDFITKLLVLDETMRLTAGEALEHDWFSNQAHRIDFQNLYKRMIKDWHPRIGKSQILSFRDSGQFERLLSPRKNTETGRKSRRIEKPVDSPHKPFPRNMYSHIWPRYPLRNTMSREVRYEVEQSWPHDANSQQDADKPRSTDMAESLREDMQGGATGYESNDSESIAEENLVSVRSMMPALDLSVVQTTELIAHEMINLPFRPVPVDPAAANSECHTEISKTRRSDRSPTPGPEDATQGASGVGIPVLSEDKEATTSLASPYRRAPVSIPNHSIVGLKSRSDMPVSRVVSTMSAIRKRKRSSIFDLEDKDENSSEDECGLMTPKKLRSPVSSGNEDDQVSPHHRTAMMNIEFDEPEYRYSFHEI